MSQAKTDWLPPANPERVYARLARLTALSIDGQAWYYARDVCAALGLNAQKALPKLPRAYKRTVRLNLGRFASLRLTAIPADGVRALIRLRGGLSLSEAMRRISSE